MLLCKLESRPANHLVANHHSNSSAQAAKRCALPDARPLREMGTHQQLLAERGIYYKLYQLQYKDQEVAASPEVTASADD